MGNSEYSTKKESPSDKFVEWLNSLELEQEEYVILLEEITSECKARLEDEKPDETSKD